MNRRRLLESVSASLMALATLPEQATAQAGQQLSRRIGSRIGSERASADLLHLSIALSSNPRTWPIIGGAVRAEGIELLPNVLHPSEMFYRQLKFAEFDISEMSLSSFMMAVANGDDRFVGLPVFTSHFFFHTFSLVRKSAEIAKPEDLRNKRVGVPEYQQTAALWARGALEHEFGVSPKEIEWWMERNPAESHGGSTAFAKPPGVTINQIPYQKNIGAMMVAGELDAALLYIVDPNLVDRSTMDLWNHPGIKPLFDDSVAEGIRYYKKTGIYPINHCMVVRRQVAERHPWVLLNILKAFKEANEIADAERLLHVENHIDVGLVPPESRDALRNAVVRHGVKANAAILEAATQYSFEQGLTQRQVRLDELFAANTLDQ
jgi:4,5-dihydroxyphthalate decarboxylase